MPSSTRRDRIARSGFRQNEFRLHKAESYGGVPPPLAGHHLIRGNDHNARRAHGEVAHNRRLDPGGRVHLLQGLSSSPDFNFSHRSSPEEIAEGGAANICLRAVDGTVWLSQREITELSDSDVRTVNQHIQCHHREGMRPAGNYPEIRIVQTEEWRQIEREVDTGNLDVILSIGYRVTFPPRRHSRDS